MKKTVIRFGLYALISGFVFFGLPFFLGMGVDYDYGELIGYTSIVLSLLFVFFGIRYYRGRNTPSNEKYCCGTKRGRNYF